VLSNVLGFTKESVVTARRAAQRPSDAQLAAGRKLVTRFNCQGCHLVEGEGQAIKTSIGDPGLLPPNLAAEGARVQSDWLFTFLHDPSRVRLRPWLTVRMPTFGFDDAQLNTLVSYCGRRPRRAVRREPPAARARWRWARWSSACCSAPSATRPARRRRRRGGGSAGDLAPSLLLSRERLRHDWCRLDPRPATLDPGTRMPSFFPSDGKGNYQSPLAQTPPRRCSARARCRAVRSEAEMDAYPRILRR
jgi:mono/diheme cytochrome c family protein